MNKISLLFFYLFFCGCSQFSLFHHQSNITKSDPVIRPILETKEIANLSKEEEEIATVIIIEFLKTTKKYINHIRQSSPEFTYNFFLKILEKNPSNYLLELNTHFEIRLLSAHEGIIRDGFVYPIPPKGISEIISIIDIDVQDDEAVVEFYTWRGPLDAAGYEIKLQKEIDGWIIQSWRMIRIS